jgi:hypothetical protein
MARVESDQQTLASMSSRSPKIVRSEKEASQRLRGSRREVEVNAIERGRMFDLCKGNLGAVAGGEHLRLGSVPTRLLQDSVRQPASSTVAATRLTRGVYSTGVETTSGIVGDGVLWRRQETVLMYTPQHHKCDLSVH